MTDRYDIRRNSPVKLKGLEIIEITPIVLGGDPSDSANKAFLNREQHIQAVRYWNQVIAELRKKMK